MLKFTAFLLLIVSLSATGFCAEMTQERIEHFIAICMADRAERIALTEKAIVDGKKILAEAKRENDVKRYEYTKGMQRGAMKRLAELKSGRELQCHGLGTPPKAGEFGRLVTRHLVVKSIIGPDRFIADMSLSHFRAVGGTVESRFLTKVPGRMETDYKTVLVSGIDTGAFITDQMIAPDDVFECTGTHTYKTAIGQNTVPVIEPIDWKAVEAYHNAHPVLNKPKH
jgi:hypothetical protein